MTPVDRGEGWVVELDERAREVVIDAPEALAPDDARELADAILKATSALGALRGARSGIS